MQSCQWQTVLLKHAGTQLLFRSTTPGRTSSRRLQSGVTRPGNTLPRTCPVRITLGLGLAKATNILSDSCTWRRTITVCPVDMENGREASGRQVCQRRALNAKLRQASRSAILPGLALSAAAIAQRPNYPGI